MIGILSKILSSWAKRPTYELCDGDIDTFQGVFSLLSLSNGISNLEIKSIVYSLQLCCLIDELTQAKLRTIGNAY